MLFFEPASLDTKIFIGILDLLCLVHGNFFGILTYKKVHIVVNIIVVLKKITLLDRGEQRPYIHILTYSFFNTRKQIHMNDNHFKLVHIIQTSSISFFCLEFQVV